MAALALGAAPAAAQSVGGSGSDPGNGGGAGGGFGVAGSPGANGGGLLFGGGGGGGGSGAAGGAGGDTAGVGGGGAGGNGSVFGMGGGGGGQGAAANATAGAGGGGGGGTGVLFTGSNGVGIGGFTFSGGNGGAGGNGTGVAGSHGGGGGSGGYGFALVGGQNSAATSANISGGAGGQGGTSGAGAGSANGGSGGGGVYFDTAGAFFRLDPGGVLRGGAGGASGIGGGAGFAGLGGVGGAGGAGIVMLQGGTIELSGTVTGGAGGGGSAVVAGAGGAGILGAGLTILNSSTITGGLSAANVRANAISVTGGASSLTTNGGSYTGAIDIAGGSLALTQTSAAGATQSATYSNVFSGAGALSATTGNGFIVTLTGANTYTGATAILAGTLALSGAGSIFQSSGVAVAGTFDISASGGTVGIRALTGGGTVALGGNGLFVSNASGEFSGAIGGTGGLEIGGGTQTLSGVNTYANATQIDAGATVALKGAGSIASSGFVGFLGAGTLDISQTNAGASVGGLFDPFGSGLVSLGSRTLTITGGSFFNGVIRDGGIGGGAGGGLAIAAGASQQLGGVNTYTGPTNIAATGTLLLGRANGADGSIAASRAVTVDGTLDISGLGTGPQATTSIVSLSGGTTGIVSLGGNRLTITNGSDTFAGSIGDDGNSGGTGGALTIAGGVTTLTGANTYTGGTTLAGGVLAVGQDANLGAATGGLAFNGGTLRVTGTAFTSTPRTITFGAAGGGFDIADAANTFAVAQALTGTGPLAKLGAGTLNLTGTSTLTGPTTVAAGTLAVNGSLAGSPVTVLPGGTIGGTGTVGGLAVQSGGTAAPGNSIGQLNVAGNVGFAAGSVFQVEVNAAGQGDRIAATGSATLAGGTVQVLAAQGNYAAQTRYTILTAAAGVNGRFAAVTSNLAFLMPSLAYDATNVFLTLSRAMMVDPATGGSVPVAFSSVATTPNQFNVAGAVQALGLGNPVFDAVLSRSAPEARLAFDRLSNEIAASTVTAGFEVAQIVRDAILGRLRSGFGAGAAVPGTASVPAAFAADLPGGRRPETAPVPFTVLDPSVFALWGQGFGSFGATGTNGNAGRLTRDTGGFVLGADATLEGAYRFGLAGGYTSTSLDVRSRLSSGEVTGGFGSAYAAAAFGPLNLRLGGVYAGSSADTRRTVIFPGFASAARGRFGGSTGQVFGEAGYRVPLGVVTLEPFAGLAGVFIGRDRYTETGGAAATTVFGRTYDLGAATAGIRAEAALAPDWQLRGLVGYRRAFGDVVPRALVAFAGTAASFGVAGVPVDRNAVVAEAGVDWKVTPDLAIGLAYGGQAGPRAYDHGVKGNIAWRF